MLSHTDKRHCCSGTEAAGVAVLDDFMAADVTFSDARALQEAIAKDVEQRIATAHLRPMPSNVAPSRPQDLQAIPGENYTIVHASMGHFILVY